MVLAAQTQLVPASEFAPGEIGAIRNQLIEKVVAQVAAKLNKAADQLIVRDIRPSSDLDYTYADWNEQTGSTSDAYETMTTGTMGDRRWIVLYGVKFNSEALSVTHLKFHIGGADRAIWNLESLNEDDGMVGVCPGGIVIPENIPYTISRYVRSASAPCNLVLKGVVIEPRGLVVSP